MFMAELMTAVTDAAKRVFDAEYPVEQFRGLHIDIEYPSEKDNYPGIWVDFEPTRELTVAGIGHVEYRLGDVEYQAFRKWTFAGHVTYTIVALSNFERARLFDEMVKVLAFGGEQAARSQFREAIESNEFIAINFDFDEIGVRGKAETLGTPWGTDEMIYEVTVAMECLGEFASEGETATLIPLSKITPIPYTVPPGDPTDWG